MKVTRLFETDLKKRVANIFESRSHSTGNLLPQIEKLAFAFAFLSVSRDVCLFGQYPCQFVCFISGHIGEISTNANIQSGGSINHPLRRFRGKRIIVAYRNLTAPIAKGKEVTKQGNRKTGS